MYVVDMYPFYPFILTYRDCRQVQLLLRRQLHIKNTLQTPASEIYCTMTMYLYDLPTVQCSLAGPPATASLFGQVLGNFGQSISNHIPLLRTPLS